MKKLIATAFMTAMLFAQPAAAESSVQSGCQLIAMLTNRNISAEPVDPAECDKTRASAGGSANTCLIAALIAYNRSRGLADLDRPPIHIRRLAAKGCMMMVFDKPESAVEAAMRTMKWDE
ncbi:hypothetical protein [Bradyrhizobium sp. URHC0002]